MKKPKNKVIDFSVASLCNYNCKYCIGINEKRGELLQNRMLYDSKKMENLFKNTLKNLKGRWIFNMGGPGEPFLIPNFLKLVEKIIKSDHKIEVVTNFSASEKKIIEFCKVAGKKLIRLNASLHLECTDLNKFLKKAILVNKEIGRQKFSVISVARKGKVFQLEKIGQKFRNKGIIFTMQLEKNSKKESQKYSNYNERESETIKKFRRSSESKKKRMLAGKRCWSGCQYFIVDYKGECWRCHSAKRMKDKNGYLGNLIEKTFKLKKTASLCPYKYCLCITPIVFKLVEKSEQ